MFGWKKLWSKGDGQVNDLGTDEIEVLNENWNKFLSVERGSLWVGKGGGSIPILLSFSTSRMAATFTFWIIINYFMCLFISAKSKVYILPCLLHSVEEINYRISGKKTINGEKKRERKTTEDKKVKIFIIGLIYKKRKKKEINPCNNNNLSLMIAPSMKHSVGDFSFYFSLM